MSTLKRITTAYVELEDRIRLTGELANGDTEVLWLTQRLVNRLVPYLTAWLERQIDPTSATPSVHGAHQDIVQGFAQQAACAQLTPKPPVQPPSSQPGWRVSAVDISQRKAAVVMTFRGEAEERATLILAAQPLRQWLGIVFEQSLRGEWSITSWPAWMETRAPAQATGRSAPVLH